jgi:prepilin-type N-terminal cleavage/methylation domain-containing protein
MRAPSPTHGFTLIELGVVLCILCILAAVVAPNFIDLARTRMAEKAASDVAEIIEAAEGFFVESEEDPMNARWPGGSVRPNKNREQCDLAHPDNSAEDDLLGSNGGNRYLRPEALFNPWGKRYEIDRVPSERLGSAEFAPRSCQLLVRTTVPSDVGPSFAALIPAGRCGLPDANGMVICQGTVPPPGAQASIRRAGESLVPP